MKQLKLYETQNTSEFIYFIYLFIIYDELHHHLYLDFNQVQSKILLSDKQYQY